MMSDEKCLDSEYWDVQYKTNNAKWDLGTISPPIKEYIDTLKNKETCILIPGCGNSHEAAYLLNQGFTNITVIDIAPTLIEKLQEKFKYNSNIKIILGDFFEHQGEYNLILEQTFFCALPTVERDKYVQKMYSLLTKKGLVVGLLFNKTFEHGPPFGGSLNEYEKLFEKYFKILTMHLCLNSIKPRANSELFVAFEKKDLK